MDNKYNEQFVLIQPTIEAKNQEMKANRQNSDDKMMKLTENFKTILASSITSIADNFNALKSLPTQEDSQKPT